MPIKSTKPPSQVWCNLSHQLVTGGRINYYEVKSIFGCRIHFWRLNPLLGGQIHYQKVESIFRTYIRRLNPLSGGQIHLKEVKSIFRTYIRRLNLEVEFNLLVLKKKKKINSTSRSNSTVRPRTAVWPRSLDTNVVRLGMPLLYDKIATTLRRVDVKAFLWT